MTTRFLALGSLMACSAGCGESTRVTRASVLDAAGNGATADGASVGGAAEAGGFMSAGGLAGAAGFIGVGAAITASGGFAGTGGAAGSGGADAGGGQGADVQPTALPTAANCPTFTNGATVQIARKNGSLMPVVIYMRPDAKTKPDPGGPIILYYHATGSNPDEVNSGFGSANIDRVTAMGGVVAAFSATVCTGCTTTDVSVWFVEDDDVQDTVVACAIQQANIDTRHIHALGWSPGAFHSDHVALARNNYVASVISYSGGALFPTSVADPSNHVATIQEYGDVESLVVDFKVQSTLWYETYEPQGWYTMLCHYGGGSGIDPALVPLSLRFFMDHPYKVNPEPYAVGVPAEFPTYCKNSP